MKGTYGNVGAIFTYKILSIEKDNVKRGEFE